MRTPYKMKSSPAKGKLGDFFKGLGASLGAKKTDMGELRNKQARSSKGVSEFEYRKKNPRVKKAKSKLETPDPKSEVKGNFSTAKTYAHGFGSDNSKIVHPSREPEKSSKPDWTKAPKVGTQARTDWYKKFNLALDDTTPGHKSKIDAGGTGAFQGDPEKENWGATSRVPLTKKSPYKKGLGKYAKQAKGSRGYKMKK